MPLPILIRRLARKLRLISSKPPQGHLPGRIQRRPALPSGEVHVATQHLVEDPEAEGVPMLDRRWYYTIEVEPDVWTTGHRITSVGIVRELLRKVDVRGVRCLDIGAMDGMIATLLCRRKAGAVVAYDRLNFNERLTWLKSQFDIDFTYRYGDTFAEFQKEQLKEPLFDLVVFAGVMYHMIDPLDGLFRARSLLRNGGIMIFETAAIRGKGGNLCYFNTGGQFYQGDNYFFPTLPLLDYWLRLAHLEPIDCIWMPQHRSNDGDEDLVRVCVACRAVPTPPAGADDQYMLKFARRRDVTDVCDLTRCIAERRQFALPYLLDRDFKKHAAGGIDLSSAGSRRYLFNPPLNLTMLAMGDRA